MTSFAHDTPQLAQTYDRASDLQFETGQRLVERIGLSPSARVLDVGCGTGRLTRWIAARLGPRSSVIGIDPLEHRITFARAHEGTARFEVGRAEDLSAFDDSSFDAVCLSSVLHWVDDKAKALAEARRVLKPRGRLALTTLPQELSRASTLSEALHAVLQRGPFAEQVDRTVGKRGTTSTELLSLVLSSGLELIELHITPTTSHHESGSAFVDFAEASSFGTLLALVPPGLREALRSALGEEFEQHRDADGVAIKGWGALLVAQRA